MLANENEKLRDVLLESANGSEKLHDALVNENGSETPYGGGLCELASAD